MYRRLASRAGLRVKRPPVLDKPVAEMRKAIVTVCAVEPTSVHSQAWVAHSEVSFRDDGCPTWPGPSSDDFGFYMSEPTLTTL